MTITLALQIETVESDINLAKEMGFVSHEDTAILDSLRRLQKIEQQEPFCIIKDFANGCIFLYGADGYPCNLHGKGGTKLYALPVMQEGYKLVPIKPTGAMLEASIEIDWGDDDVWQHSRKKYKAMLAVSEVSHD